MTIKILTKIMLILFLQIHSFQTPVKADHQNGIIDPPNQVIQGPPLRGTMMNSLIRHVIELCRQGLLESGMGNMSVPDVDWTIDSDNLHGVIHTSDLRVTGIPEFNIKNLTSSLAMLKVDIDMEFPLIEATGNYHIKVKIMGIPISWDGRFALQFSRLELSGGGQLKAGTPLGSSNFIEFSKPFVGPEAVGFVFDGFPGRLNLFKIILFGLLTLLIYTVVVVVVFTKIFLKKNVSNVKKVGQKSRLYG